MRSALTAAALLVTLTTGTSCAGGGLLLNDRSLAADSEGYRDLLRRWTRQHKVYRHFEALIFATGTYLSPEFREALIQRRTRLLGLPVSESHRLKAEHDERSERFHEFIVSVYTSERRWNDLDLTPSMWRVSLTNDRGEEVLPLEVIRQDLRTGDLQAYFPYISAFQQAYLVRFPKQSLELNAPIVDPSVQVFSLRFLSGIAVANLTWSLDDSPDREFTSAR